MATSHAKVLEYIPSENKLLLRAGIGWKPGYVGVYKVSPDVDTPIGSAYALAEPSVVEDYREETRFRYPQILVAHGCVSSVNVAIRTESSVFGVLEVDDVAPRKYTIGDINFLAGLGNTIAAAVELNRTLSEKNQAISENELLMHEMNHRIKNNLALVASLLSLQSRTFEDERLRREFHDAIARIHNLALVHDRLRMHPPAADRIDANAYLNSLAEMLRSLLPQGIHLRCEAEGELPTNNIEAISLIANELVTNAAKYAFADRQSGNVTLGFRNRALGWQLTVRDDGVGLPQNFDDAQAKSFGMRLLRTLANQLNATINFQTENGTKIEVVALV